MTADTGLRRERSESDRASLENIMASGFGDSDSDDQGASEGAQAKD